MSDSTGVFQHAIFTIPRFEDGYCTDDNARALLLTVMLQEQCDTGTFVGNLQSVTAAFLQNAFVKEVARFRNFMAFNRNWSEAEGSEDSHGRALWALGAVVRRASDPGLRSWAASLLRRLLHLYVLSLRQGHGLLASLVCMSIFGRFMGIYWWIACDGNSHQNSSPFSKTIPPGLDVGREYCGLR